MAAGAVSLLLQNYRDRFVQAHLNDMTVALYVQAVSLLEGRTSWNEVWDNFETVAEETGIYIIMVNDAGKITRQAAPPVNLLRNTSELTLDDPTPANDNPYFGTYDVNRRHTLIYKAYPLNNLAEAGRLEASTLILALPQSGTLVLLASLVRPFIWAGLIGLGASLGIAILLARSVYRPIKRISEAAGEVARGNYDQEIKVSGPREIVSLAATFNEMSQQVKASHQRLRDFVADVSHQLRTPPDLNPGFRPGHRRRHRQRPGGQTASGSRHRGRVPADDPAG